MKVFTIAMAACKGEVASVIPGATEAPDKPMAIEAGVDMCKRKFPPEEGWSAHQAVVHDITDWLVEVGYLAPLKEECDEDVPV